jgi:hypothetical protein
MGSDRKMGSKPEPIRSFHSPFHDTIKISQQKTIGRPEWSRFAVQCLLTANKTRSGGAARIRMNSLIPNSFPTWSKNSTVLDPGTAACMADFMFRRASADDRRDRLALSEAVRKAVTAIKNRNSRPANSHR